MKKIIFWQNASSIHQAPFMKALAKQVSVEVCVGETIGEKRSNMGWEMPDYGEAMLQLLPKEAVEKKCFIDLTLGYDAIHIISGIYPNNFSLPIFNALHERNFRFGVISEPFRNDEVFYSLRLAKAYFKSIRFKSSMSFLLATGSLAEKQLVQIGVPKEKVFQFGYFVEAFSKTICTSDHYKGEVFEILFVGRFIQRKGISILFKALERINKYSFRLCMIGDGEQKERLTKLAISLGIDSKVEWIGTVSNEYVKRLISLADLLVLPSTFDGWGAVISESLMNGTPVVCSDACGASILIRQSGFGKVFSSQNITELSTELEAMILKGKPSDSRRSEIKKWSKNHISPEIAANYFLQIIDFTEGANKFRPTAPWIR